MRKLAQHELAEKVIRLKVSGKQAVTLLREKGQWVYDDNRGTLIIMYKSIPYLVWSDENYSSYADLDDAIKAAVKMTEAKAPTKIIIL